MKKIPLKSPGSWLLAPGSWLLIFALLPTGAFGQSSPAFVKLTDNVPAALMHAEYVGHHDPSTILPVTVALKLRNTTQLDTFLLNLQDPTSPEYHQFLTPAQFTDMYGPTQDQVAAVVQYLEQNGVQVTDVTPNNLLIHAQAESGIFEQLWGITINDYTYDGRNIYGTLNDP